MIAWAFDPAALGPPPPGVELADELGPEVAFAVPDDPLQGLFDGELGGGEFRQGAERGVRDIELLQARADFVRRDARFRNVEEDDVRHDRFRVNPDAVHLRQTFGETTRIGVIFVQELRRFFERD